MKQLMKRPLAFAGISFYIVSFLLSYAGNSIKLGVVVAAAVIVALLTVFSVFCVNCRGVLSALSLVFVFILGASAISYYNYAYKPSKFLWNDGNTHSVVAEAGETYYSSSYGSLQIVKVSSVDGEAVRFKLLCEMNGSAYTSGTKLSFDSELLPISDAYSGQDLRTYMSDGAVGYAYPYSLKAEINTKPSLSSRAALLSSKLSGILCSALGYKNGGFASALLLGNKTFLDTDVRHDFTRTGIAHLLAISGIHLTVIASYISVIIKRLTKSRIAGAVSAIIIAIVYSVVAGLSMSIVRAAVMLTVTSLGTVISKRSDLFTSLAVAVCGILLVNPYAAGSISLMLSFASIVGIGMFDSLRRENAAKSTKHPIIKKLLSSVSVSLAVFAATLPVSWLYFDEISLLSPLTNLIFIPLVSVILLLLPLFLLLSFASVPFMLAAKPLSALITFTLNLAEYFGTFRHITVSTAVPTFPAVIAVITVAFAASALVGKSKRKYCAAAITASVIFMLLSVIFLRAATAGKTDVIMTAYSSNDEVLVISDNKTLLCDVSDGSYSPALTGIDAMLSETYSELDAYMFTHYHQRHVYSFRKLLRRMRIDTVIIPLPISETDKSVYSALAELAESYGCKIIVYDRESPQSIDFGDCKIEPTEYATVSRSTHPIISFAVIADRSFAYLGGASNEKSALPITEKFAEYDVLCYGIHSPIYKKPLNVSGSSVFYNEALLSQNIDVAVSDGAIPYSSDVYAKVRISD